MRMEDVAPTFSCLLLLFLGCEYFKAHANSLPLKINGSLAIDFNRAGSDLKVCAPHPLVK